jgi:hypothetical protein
VEGCPTRAAVSSLTGGSHSGEFLRGRPASIRANDQICENVLMPEDPAARMRSSVLADRPRRRTGEASRRCRSRFPRTSGMTSHRPWS